MELPRIRIGTNEEMLPVYLQGKDRYRHVLLTGKSGTGKSSLLSNWWKEDELWKVSRVLVEPTGFLSKDNYSISKGKALYCSLQNPISVNFMLSGYDENTISDLLAETVNQMVALCSPNQPFTVKMRDILDQETKRALRNNRKSLLAVLDYIKNRQGDFETRDGIIRRLSFILNDERLQKIICGNQAVKWGELIGSQKSLIINCEKMSREKQIFLGCLVTGGLEHYLRFDSPKEYKPISLYLDEGVNFLTPSVLSILREARKYKLGAIISLIDFNIPESILRSVINVGSILTFRVGAREASYIAREMNIKPPELQFLERFHIAYMTPKESGICKAPRPPFIKRMEIKSVEPARKPRMEWYLRRSCQAT